jgi:hypothetical protein
MPKWVVHYVETVFYDVEVEEAEDSLEAKDEAEEIVNMMSTEEFKDLFMSGESNVDEVTAEEIE